MKDFISWLNEEKMSPINFILEFIEKVKEEKFSGVEFVDWWSISKRDFDERDVAYLDSLENVERRKPEELRHRGDVWFLEFKVTRGDAHFYTLVSVDLKTWEFFVHKDRHQSFSEKIEKLYNEHLKTHYPQIYSGKKYGI